MMYSYSIAEREKKPAAFEARTGGIDACFACHCSPNDDSGGGGGGDDVDTRERVISDTKTTTTTPTIDGESNDKSSIIGEPRRPPLLIRVAVDDGLLTIIKILAKPTISNILARHSRSTQFSLSHRLSAESPSINSIHREPRRPVSRTPNATWTRTNLPRGH